MSQTQFTRMSRFNDFFLKYTNHSLMHFLIELSTCHRTWVAQCAVGQAVYSIEKLIKTDLIGALFHRLYMGC